MSLTKPWSLIILAGLAACAAPTVSRDLPTTVAPIGSAVAQMPPTPTPGSQATPGVTNTPIVNPTPAPITGAFVKMEVPAAGSFTLDPIANTVRFSADFSVSTGPDLFVILSGANDLTLDYVAFSKTVTAAPILYLGPLANLTGEQVYTIPPGVDLIQYRTIVVWCKQYSVAFAAAPLPR